MSSIILHDFLILFLGLALQLVSAIVVGATIASGYFLPQAWVGQRERVDGLQERLDQHRGRLGRHRRGLNDYQETLDQQRETLDQHQRRLDRHQTRIDWDLGRIDQHGRDIELLCVHRHDLTYRLRDLEQGLLRHFRRYNNDRAVVAYNFGDVWPGHGRQPQPQQWQPPPSPFAGPDGQDERGSDINDEAILSTQVIGNTAARRSRKIADAVDPWSYGIIPKPSTSSDDDEDTSHPVPLTQSDLYETSLGGSTLCDEAEEPQAIIRGGGYQERPSHHFGYYDYKDDDDPHPHLPHPDWAENDRVVVTTTTTTQSAPIATVTGPVPSASVTVSAAAQPATQDPRINLPSLATAQNVEASVQAGNGLASYGDHGTLPENRINIPASRFLSRDLQDVHMRRNGRRIAREQAQNSAKISASNTPLSWTPPPSNVVNGESSVRPVGLWSPPVQTEGAKNRHGSTTSAERQRPRILSEEEAAFMHGTPEQWPDSSHQIDGTDEADEQSVQVFTLRPYHRAYSQHQADEFIQLHPRLVRPGQGPNIRRGSNHTPPEEEEMTVEEAQLFDRVQRQQPGAPRGLQDLQMQEQLQRYRMQIKSDEQVKEVRTPQSMYARYADIYDHESPSHRRNRVRMEADVLRHNEAQYAALSQSHHYSEHQYAEHGYQHHLEAEDDHEEEEIPNGVHQSQDSSQNQQQREPNDNERQRLLTHLQDQHALEAPEESFHIRSPPHARPIYHVPPFHGSVPRGQSSHHRHLQRQIDDLATLRMIWEAQSLEECESIDSHLTALQSALAQKRAEIAAGQRPSAEANRPTVYVNTGDHYVQTTRSKASTIPERRLFSNAGNAARAKRNFNVVNEDVYSWYGQYPSDYDNEQYASGHYHGQEEADERGVMDDLISHRSGSVTPFIRGGASDFDDLDDLEDEAIYQSSDYDPVAVSRAIANLNKKMVRAKKRAVDGAANDDVIANFMHRIAWLRSQRDYAEGFNGSLSVPAGSRGGAENDEYDDHFRVRHPECSSDTADTATHEILELEKEIERLHPLMAKAQRLPEGDQSNRDVLAQLQRMIDRLEAERDAAQNSKVNSDTHEEQNDISPRCGGGEVQEVHSYERDLAYGLGGCPIPPLPPRNPAREDRRPPAIAYLRGDSLARSDAQTELDEVIDLITLLDKSRAWIEPLILAHIASPEIDRKNVSYETIALIIKLDRLLEIRQGLWRRAKVLAFPDESAMATVRGYATAATTSSNAFKLCKTRPHSTEARLRGGGSAQPTIEEEGEVERVVPGSFPNNAAPPVPARNPARIRGGASSTPIRDSDLDREIATLERDIVRASQQFQARVSQVAPSRYFASLEADNIERLAAKHLDLQRRRARNNRSHASASMRRDSCTGTDAETQAERSAIWRSLTAIDQAAGAWAPGDDNVNAPAPELQSPEPRVSSPPAPTHPLYRVLNYQDWTWPHPNWQFDNLSPSQKISLLRERSSWLACQRDIQEEQRAIDNEITRLRSILALDRDLLTYRNLITPGFDGLGNWEGGYLARQYNRSARLRGGAAGNGYPHYPDGSEKEIRDYALPAVQSPYPPLSGRANAGDTRDPMERLPLYVQRAYAATSLPNPGDLRLLISPAAMWSHLHNLPHAERLSKLRERLQYLRCLHTSPTYAQSSIDHELSWLETELRLQSDPALRQAQAELEHDKRDLPPFRSRVVNGHYDGKRVRPHPEAMYLHLADVEKCAAMKRRFDWLVSVPTSPELDGVTKMKEAEWLAAEIEKLGGVEGEARISALLDPPFLPLLVVMVVLLAALSQGTIAD